MRNIFPLVLTMAFWLPVQAEEWYVPEGFQQGQKIEHLILISDVDGVVREGIRESADPRVIEAVEKLLENAHVDVTFLSGTPVINDSTLEPWRLGNFPLTYVFGSTFDEQMEKGRVAIYGVLGAQRLQSGGRIEILDEYPPEVAFELGKLLVQGFLKEVQAYGSEMQKALAFFFLDELKDLKLEDPSQPNNVTPREFSSLAESIRYYMDPNFRLISNGSSVESHTTNPPWSSRLSYKWLVNELDHPEHLVCRYPHGEKKAATGVAHMDGQSFNYLIVCKKNKGVTTEKIIAEKLKEHPNALVVTIGDTQVDFPMHRNAHLAFHVGMESVWEEHEVPQCMMIRHANGDDSQHIEGTLKVLQLLQDGLGQSFDDLKYIPNLSQEGEWEFCSLNELRGK